MAGQFAADAVAVKELNEKKQGRYETASMVDAYSALPTNLNPKSWTATDDGFCIVRAYPTQEVDIKFNINNVWFGYFHYNAWVSASVPVKKGDVISVKGNPGNNWSESYISHMYVNFIPCL